MQIEFSASFALRLPAGLQVTDIIEVEVRLSDENNAAVVYATTDSDNLADENRGHAVFGCFDWSVSEQVAAAVREAVSAAQEASNAPVAPRPVPSELMGAPGANRRLRFRAESSRQPPSAAEIDVAMAEWAPSQERGKTALVAELNRLVAAYQSGGEPAAQTELDGMLGERPWLQIEQTVLLGRFRRALMAEGIVPPQAMVQETDSGSAGSA